MVALPEREISFAICLCEKIIGMFGSRLPSDCDQRLLWVGPSYVDFRTSVSCNTSRFRCVLVMCDCIPGHRLRTRTVIRSNIPVILELPGYWH
jgi:hypothetical protein